MPPPLDPPAAGWALSSCLELFWLSLFLLQSCCSSARESFHGFPEPGLLNLLKFGDLGERSLKSNSYLGHDIIHVCLVNYLAQLVTHTASIPPVYLEGTGDWKKNIHLCQ